MADGIRHYEENSVAQNMFRLRMQQQVSLIDAYRRRVIREEGRNLSRNQAALEWIERHAATYIERA